MSNGENKGLSPGAWIAIGCGALALVAFFGIVAVAGFGIFKAKQVVDDIRDDGEFSISTPEGKVKVDVSGEDGGSLTIEGPDGQEVSFGADASLENVPEWVPIYPEASQAQGSFHTKTPEGVQGVASVRTDDPPQEVVSYYKQWFEDQGYEIRNESTTNSPQGSISTLSGALADPARTLNLGVIVHDDATQITINYSGESG